MNKSVIYKINFIVDSDLEKFTRYISDNERLKFINYEINAKSYGERIIVTYENDYFFRMNGREYNNLDSLLDQELIVPQFFDSNVTDKLYIKKLAKLEHRKNDIYAKEKSHLDKIINKNLDVNNGINDIYEWSTGAIYFKDYEWEELENTKLKSLFELQNNNSYIYSLPLNNGIILRGSDIYYYFCSDVTRFRKPNIDEIKKWYDNVSIFINKLIISLKDYSISDNYSKRLLLGAVDNLRNIILILTNTELMLLYNNKDFIYYENCHNKIIDEYFNLIKEYQDIINNICIFNNADNSVATVKNICSKLLELKDLTFKKTLNISDSFLLGKCYNLLREIDNYFENYIVCHHIVKSNLFKKKNINLIGILYGGLELPFIIKSLYRNKVNISFTFQYLGMYLEKQKKNTSTINTELVEYGKCNKNLSTFLIDDNIMSGITMQFNYNKFYLNNFKKICGVLLIRHPSMNRIGQMEYFNVGLNIELVDKFVFGMIMHTPYTKVKRNTNYNNEFLNELGIFSDSTETFLKALYCNNSFIKDSQVDIFKGYSSGRN